MFTLFLMLVAAYAAIAFDAFIIDRRYGHTESFGYYAKLPSLSTAKNTAVVVWRDLVPMKVKVATYYVRAKAVQFWTLLGHEPTD